MKRAGTVVVTFVGLSSLAAATGTAKLSHEWTVAAIESCQAVPPQPFSCPISKMLGGSSILVTLVLLLSAYVCFVSTCRAKGQ